MNRFGRFVAGTLPNSRIHSARPRLVRIFDAGMVPRKTLMTILRLSTPCPNGQAQPTPNPIDIRLTDR